MAPNCQNLCNDLITAFERVRLTLKAHLKGKQVGFRHCLARTPTLAL